MNTKKCDLHCHSSFSFDADDDINLLINNAKKNGVKYLSVTDHFECNEPQMDAVLKDILKSISFQNEYKDKEITLLSGVEIGQALQNQNAYNSLVKATEIDFILCSLHNNEGVCDYYYFDEEQAKNYKKYLHDYFNEILKMVEWGNFCSLAHLTYPERYLYINHDILVDFKEYDDIIYEILKLLVRYDKAIEINMSGIFSKTKQPMPTAYYLKMFKDLGGKYVTIGSDSHDSTFVGRGFDTAIDLLNSLGFNGYTIFKKQKPIIIGD